MGRRSALMGQMQMTNPNQPYNHAELGERNKLKFYMYFIVLAM